MDEFEFTLKFSIPEAKGGTETYIEQLAAEGCDDALIGIGQAGRIALDFTREAGSAFDAVASAIADVKRAIPEARLVEATPDLVGLTDVAHIIGCSRQYMRKLMISSGARFPIPVHEGKSALWRLSKVLIWLQESKQYQVEGSLMDVAQTTMQFNIARDALDIDSAVQQNIRGLMS